jgi:hypothetical protein
MAGIYGATWTRAYGDDPAGTAGKTWAIGLAEFSGRQIADGLNACMRATKDFPPSLPAFRAMCYGIPSLEFVRADIGRRSNPFTRMVWQYVDGWAFSRADQWEAARILSAAYDFAKERRMLGDELPAEPAGEIEHKPAPFVPASPDTVARSLDEIASLLRESDRGTGSDDNNTTGETQ